MCVIHVVLVMFSLCLVFMLSCLDSRYRCCLFPVIVVKVRSVLVADVVVVVVAVLSPCVEFADVLFK